MCIKRFPLMKTVSLTNCKLAGIISKMEVLIVGIGE